MSDSEAKPKDSAGNVVPFYPNGIHDAGALKSVFWDVKMTNDKGSINNVLKYNFKVSAKRCSKKREIVWKTSLTGRYAFKIAFKLDVSIVNNGIIVANEMFDLEPGIQEQTFTTAVNENCSVDDKNATVVVKLRCFPEGSITEWLGSRTDFKGPERTHNVVICVGDTKFYVLREYLATWSRYFDRLFYGEFADKNKTEIKLEDVDAEEFHDILCLIHGDCLRNINGNTHIHDGNVVSVLKLADRLDMPSVMSRCGKYLKDLENCPTMSVFDRIELADKYNLVSLLLACLEKIHAFSQADFAKFREENRDRLRMLSHNTLANII